jgi:hypothetical protein
MANSKITLIDSVDENSVLVDKLIKFIDVVVEIKLYAEDVRDNIAKTQRKLDMIAPRNNYDHAINNYLAELLRIDEIDEIINN